MWQQVPEGYFKNFSLLKKKRLIEDLKI